MNGQQQQQSWSYSYRLFGRAVLLDREQRTPTEADRPSPCSRQQEQRPQQEQQRLAQRKVAHRQQPALPSRSSGCPDKLQIVEVSDDRLLTAHLKADGYALGFSVGQGAYGKVRVATKLASNVGRATAARRIACKVIDKLQKSGNGAGPSTYVSKFLPRELDVLCTIRHPHVVQTHRIYEAPSSVLIFMDYCEMGDLLGYMRNVGYMPPWQVHLFFKQICEAVEYLHWNGIAHRDIKCENILLENSQHVKLTDFGFARMCADERGRRVISQTYCGSSMYTAPEILQGLPYDPKVSDIWSMGVVLYVMLTKRMPYPQKHRQEIVVNQMARNLNKPTKPINIEAQSLISIILEPDVMRRATMNQIMRHRWVMQSVPVLC